MDSNSKGRLRSEYFRRRDESDDKLFYNTPQFESHIDEVAVTFYSTTLAALLPQDIRVLDLMSSWRSHLPSPYRATAVTGLGLNQAELEANPQLTERVIHDLNEDPRLPFDNGHFGAVICALSVQYLTQPVLVFKEVNRVLIPGGIFVVSFSSNYYSSKVIAAWLVTSDKQRIQLVGHYFRLAGNWTRPKIQAHVPSKADPLYIMWAQRSTGETL